MSLTTILPISETALLAMVLLPAVNRRLARWTGGKYVRLGLQLADALKDGKISPEEVQALIDGYNGK